jgi:hypothetical protein
MQVNLVSDIGLAHTGRWLADTPATWENPPPMSTLHALLLFVGVPAALFVGISLLAIAPSIIKGPRYRPGEEWNAQPEWFGVPDALKGASPAQLEAPSGANDEDDSKRGAGGASAGW